MLHIDFNFDIVFPIEKNLLYSDFLYKKDTYVRLKGKFLFLFIDKEKKIPQKNYFNRNIKFIYIFRNLITIFFFFFFLGFVTSVGVNIVFFFSLYKEFFIRVGFKILSNFLKFYVRVKKKPIFI